MSRDERIALALRAWADTQFEATAPQSFLLYEAADALLREREKNTAGGASIRKDDEAVERYVQAETALAFGVCPTHGTECQPPSASPAPARAEWTEEQEAAAASVSRVLHDQWARFMRDPLQSPPPIDEMCKALQAVAPRFVKPVQVPHGYAIKSRHTGRDADRIAAQVDAVWIAALRAAGIPIEGDER